MSHLVRCSKTPSRFQNMVLVFLAVLLTTATRAFADPDPNFILKAQEVWSRQRTSVQD